MIFFKVVFRLFLLYASSLVLIACSPTTKDETADWPVERLYREASGEFDDGNWSHSRELLEKLQARYPFGRYAEQAELKEAYTYYKQGEMEQAQSTLARFMKENPNHPDIDYALYLKGLTYFITPPAVIGRLIHYKIEERDPKALTQSFDAFKELVLKYPNSRYARDAKIRMRYLAEKLAQHESEVADYYLKKGAYAAAIERSQDLIRNYPNTDATKSALETMHVAYDRLGLNVLRDDTERVLQQSK